MGYWKAEWSESHREGRPFKCPSLPIILHKADILFTPHLGRYMTTSMFLNAYLLSGR